MHGMAHSVEELRVFIASPGDTKEERAKIPEVIQHINKSELAGKGYRLESVAFETDVTPDFGTDPQAVINDQVGDDWDIFIGVLKGKFGTLTPRAGSGTEEEFNRAYERWSNDNRSCKIMLYFYDGRVSMGDLTTDALQELMKVKAFRQRVPELGGIYSPYTDVGNFGDNLHSHLVRAVHTYGRSWGPSELGQEAVEVETEEDETTIIDLAADGEEAMETLAASLQRMTVALKTLGGNFQTRTSEANRLSKLGGVSAKRVRGLMRAAADDVDAARTTLDSEIPLYKSSWSTYKDSVYELVSRAVTLSEEDKAAIRKLVASIGEFRGAVEGGLESLKLLKLTVNELKGNRDLNRACREMIATLSILEDESLTILTETTALENTLRELLG